MVKWMVYFYIDIVGVYLTSYVLKTVSNMMQHRGIINTTYNDPRFNKYTQQMAGYDIVFYDWFIKYPNIYH